MPSMTVPSLRARTLRTFSWGTLIVLDVMVFMSLRTRPLGPQAAHRMSEGVIEMSRVVWSRGRLASMKAVEILVFLVSSFMTPTLLVESHRMPFSSSRISLMRV